MPRVSEQHLAARRRQILEAAKACFRRQGFHATSMQHIIAEANLSVGAVYRYFKSKNEIVGAIADEVFGGVDDVLAEMVERNVSLIDLMSSTLKFVDGQTGEDGTFRITIPVWAEALRDPALAEVVESAYSRVRRHWVTAARNAGLNDPEASGAVLFGMVLSFALQKMLAGGPDRETFLNGVRALLPQQG